MKDYYKILGVKKNANNDDIKRAYRKIALKYHPDKNPSKDAISFFIEATEAYEILINKLSRDEYDSFYQSNSESSYNQTEYWKKQKTWSNQGKKKAEEYSALKYEKFARRAFEETRLGISYIPNIFAILFVGMTLVILINYLIHTYNTDHIVALLLLLLVLSGGYLEYNLFSAFILDYLEDRSRKLN